MSIHIRPTASLAERALLPADPGLALALAQALLDRPRMFNHAFGLWGYTGLAADGESLTVQSTGIGGPSAAIVLDELIGLGLRRAIRVGTCAPLPVIRPASASGTAAGAVAAPDPAAWAALELGDLLITDAAFCADGTSQALGSRGLAHADEGLTAAMARASAQTRRGRVVSTDVFYPPGEADVFHARQDDDRAVWSEAAGALAGDLETAALFALGQRRAIAVGCVLVVSDRSVGALRVRIDDDRLQVACHRAGRLGAAGLGVGAEARAETRAESGAQARAESGAEARAESGAQARAESGAQAQAGRRSG